MMITFENITKKYKDVNALNRISFEIKEGEIFGYIGPNGAGKTTCGDDVSCAYYSRKKSSGL